MVKLNAVLKAYPNECEAGFKQFPLYIHSQQRWPPLPPLAAHPQGKFWPLHDAMFADRTHLSRKTILAMAGAAGLDTKRFEQDWDSAAIKQRWRASRRKAIRPVWMPPHGLSMAR